MTVALLPARLPLPSSFDREPYIRSGQGEGSIWPYPHPSRASGPMSRRKLAKPRKTRVFHRRTPPGTAPGTVRSDQATAAVTITLIEYGGQHLSERKLNSIADLNISKTDSRVYWIDVVGLGNAAVIEAIGRRFDLHPLALEDVVHVHQRAKAEEYETALFIVARMLDQSERLQSEQVSLFLGSNFVITFQQHPGDCFDPVRQRIRQFGRIQTKGADYLAYALLDAIIDAYFPRVEEYGARLDELEERIWTSQRHGLLNELHEIRRDLLQLRKLLWQHREAVNALIRRELPLIAASTQPYLRDCYDHIIQLMDVTETFREFCTNLQELQLAEIGLRTNDVMKVLTLIATIFMPMSFVAGVYGMNFDPEVSGWNMPELGWRMGYPFALSIMAAIAGGMVTFFWFRGWLSR